jgi:hypothetical protein
VGVDGQTALPVVLADVHVCARLGVQAIYKQCTLPAHLPDVAWPASVSRSIVPGLYFVHVSQALADNSMLRVNIKRRGFV